MQITMNPTNALQCRDYANYALMLRSNPMARQEIRKALNDRAPAKYPSTAPDADFETFAAFEDFALFFALAFGCGSAG